MLLKINKYDVTVTIMIAKSKTDRLYLLLMQIGELCSSAVVQVITVIAVKT